MKTILLQLPVYGADEGSVSDAPSAVSGMYTKLVTSKMSHIEAILKLVATPEDMLGERFRAMWPTGLGSDLQMIMNLKGIARPDQQRILDSVGTSAGVPGVGGVGAGAGAGAGGMLSGVSGSLSSSVSSGYSVASSSSASMMNSFTSSARSAVRAVGNLAATGTGAATK